MTLQSDFAFANRLAAGSSQVRVDLRFTCRETAPFPPDWQSTSPLYVSNAKTESKESSFAIYTLAEYSVIHFADTADYYLWPDQIYCHLLNPIYDYWVEIGFLGSVMSLWLELQGVLALHASAVTIFGRAVGFLGSKQGGKTSLAATLAQAGHLLLTDDILPIKRQESALWGCPGYPQMRMWLDLVEQFLEGDRDWPQVHPSLTKRRIPVGSEGLGKFCPTMQPMGCLYLPERRDASVYGIDICITPVPPQKAMLELVYYAFAAPVLSAFADLQSSRFCLLAEIAQRVPVRHLAYPAGYEHLPRVRAAICRDRQN